MKLLLMAVIAVGIAGAQTPATSLCFKSAKDFSAVEDQREKKVIPCAEFKMVQELRGNQKQLVGTITCDVNQCRSTDDRGTTVAIYNMRTRVTSYGEQSRSDRNALIEITWDDYMRTHGADEALRSSKARKAGKK